MTRGNLGWAWFASNYTKNVDPKDFRWAFFHEGTTQGPASFCFVCVSQQLFISKRLFESNLADSLVGHRVATQKFGGRHGDLDQGWDKCDTKRQRYADAFNFDVTVTVYVIFASSSEFDGDLILAWNLWSDLPAICQVPLPSVEQRAAFGQKVYSFGLQESQWFSHNFVWFAFLFFLLKASKQGRWDDGIRARTNLIFATNWIGAGLHCRLLGSDLMGTLKPKFANEGMIFWCFLCAQRF